MEATENSLVHLNIFGNYKGNYKGRHEFLCVNLWSFSITQTNNIVKDVLILGVIKARFLIESEGFM